MAPSFHVASRGVGTSSLFKLPNLSCLKWRYRSFWIAAISKKPHGTKAILHGYHSVDILTAALSSFSLHEPLNLSSHPKRLGSSPLYLKITDRHLCLNFRHHSPSNCRTFAVAQKFKWIQNTNIPKTYIWKSTLPFGHLEELQLRRC